MACLKLSVILLITTVLMANANPLSGSSDNSVEDQLTSGSEASNSIVPDSEVAATNTKGDLKGSDSFGLGYYLPYVQPTIVKYHYPLVYYHPTTYLHSIRHHGYGGYGFYHHGHSVLH